MSATLVEGFRILGFLGLWMALTVGLFFLITYPVWVKELTASSWWKKRFKR